jgi:hypothetical protein
MRFTGRYDMHSDAHTAHKTTLASCDLCQVEHCGDCDVVHVHVGHASVRLTLSGYFALCATLVEAARRLERQADLLRSPMRTGLQ